MPTTRAALVPVVLLAVLPFPGVSAGPARREARLEMRPVTLELGGRSVTVYRGTLRVPIVRSDPDSKEIGIDVWRFPAGEGADPATPPIFQLHGGPGWEGVEAIDPRRYQGEIVHMSRSSDLVWVGQRGIGTSTDMACGAVAPPPGGVERSQAEADEALFNACAACRSYWEGEGYDLSGLNVLEAAADVDDVRRLLGYERIAIWGTSYGSHWGMAVLREYPERVARALLSGMEGPDHTYDDPAGVLHALERMAAEAEAAPELAPHVPEGGLVEAFRAVVERVEREPATVEVEGEPVRITADDVRGVALGVSGHTGSRRGARTWAADVLALHAGDFERLARRKLGRASAPDELPTASFFMLDCGSGISPERLERYRNDPATEVVGDLTHWYRIGCAAWDADLGEAFRAGFHTEVPTVIVQGTWDTSTPLENALELLPSFESHHLVLVDGGSHGALREAMGHSADFRDAVMRFLATGETGGLPTDVALPPLDWAAPY